MNAIENGESFICETTKTITEKQREQRTVYVIRSDQKLNENSAKRRWTVEELSSQQVTNRWSGDEAVKKDKFDLDLSLDDIELDFNLDSLLDDFEIDLSLDEIDFDFDFEIPSEIELNSERTVRKRKSNKERTKRKSKS